MGDVLAVSRSHRGKSDSQANAEALARRGAPYGLEHDRSIAASWQVGRRGPRDLRDAERRVRRAYEDEVPAKLHDGLAALADDGTPRMTARAVGYIFGSPDSSDVRYDPETGRPADLISFYHSPFRAALARLEMGSDTERRRARIVQHVTIGQMRAPEAARAEGAHPMDAKLVAWDALAAFLRTLTDIKVHAQEPLDVAS